MMKDCNQENNTRYPYADISKKEKTSTKGQGEVCRACSGSGRIRLQQGFFAVEQNCNFCNGTGRVPAAEAAR